MRRRPFLAAASATALGVLAGCNQVRSTGGIVTQSVETSFDPAEVDGIRIVNDIGNVTVRARDVTQVDTRILKRSTDGQAGLDDIQATTTLDDGTLTVRTRIDRDAGWFSRNSPTTDVTVTVPQADAGPPVSEITSQLGDVTLLNTRGDTDVSTQLGTVTARDVDGYPALESQLGDIVATGTTGLRDVFTELGEVDVELRDVRGDIDITTELGDILVTIAADLAIDIVAQSTAGIDSTLDLTNAQQGTSRLTGQLNGGGPRVRVATELGNIALRSGDLT